MSFKNKKIEISNPITSKPEGKTCDEVNSKSSDKIRNHVIRRIIEVQKDYLDVLRFHLKVRLLYLIFRLFYNISCLYKHFANMYNIFF